MHPAEVNLGLEVLGADRDMVNRLLEKLEGHEISILSVKAPDYDTGSELSDMSSETASLAQKLNSILLGAKAIEFTEAEVELVGIFLEEVATGWMGLASVDGGTFITKDEQARAVPLCAFFGADPSLADYDLLPNAGLPRGITAKSLI